MAQQDTFLEQMVKKGSARQDLIHRLYLIGGAVLIIAIVFIFGYNAVILAGPVVFVMVALMLWILWRRAAQEFEYICTESNLDIDVVFSRSSRKHLFSGDIRKAEIIAPYGSEELEEVLPGYKFDKTIYACKGKPDQDTYGIVAEYMSREYLVYFDPDERILAHIREISPRNSVIRKEDLEKHTPSYWETLPSKKSSEEPEDEEVL